MIDERCGFCGDVKHKKEDCPSSWDSIKVKKGYLIARRVLQRLLSGNIFCAGIMEVAKREAAEALNPKVDDSLSSDKVALMEQANLCMGELPQTHTEMNNNFWKAFEAGRKYERSLIDGIK